MRRPFVLATACLLLMSAVGAGAQQLPPRPQISDYEDQAAFVADVLAWEKLRDQLANSPAPEPETSDAPHDWHHVTGPEDLETAIMNAEGYEQPVYREQLRFNRTTHISFPLPKLDSREMAEKAAAAEAAALKEGLLNEVELLSEYLHEQLDQLRALTAQTPGALDTLANRTN